MLRENSTPRVPNTTFPSYTLTVSDSRGIAGVKDGVYQIQGSQVRVKVDGKFQGRDLCLAFTRDGAPLTSVSGKGGDGFYTISGMPAGRSSLGVLIGDVAPDQALSWAGFEYLPINAEVPKRYFRCKLNGLLVNFYDNEHDAFDNGALQIYGWQHAGYVETFPYYDMM